MSRLTNFLNPASIAIVGASETPGKIGSRVVTTLQGNGFTGTLLPVNPGRETIHGVKTWPDQASLPQVPDLVILCVPAPAIPAALEEGAARGAKNCIVVSSGFAEAGPEGAALQERVLEIGRRHGLNISGPNSEGFYNVPRRIAATFSPAVNIDPGRGGPCRRVGVVAQSGGLGFALFNRGRADGLEFSTIVSVGNQSDLEVSDYAEALLDDEETAVILIFVEGLKNPERFRAFARRAAQLDKPVVVAKVGGSEAGKRAVESHTGSLSGSDSAYDAIFARYGVLRARGVEEMMDMAAAFTRYKRVRGNRVAVISSSGGTAAWLTDTAEAHGLTLPVIDAERQAQLQSFIPSFGATGNPIDLTGHGMNGISRSLEILTESPDLDAIIVAGSFAHEGRLSLEGEAIRDITLKSEIPVLLYTYSQTSKKARALLDGWDLHHFTSMDGVCRAVAAGVKRARFLADNSLDELDTLATRNPLDSGLAARAEPVVSEYEAARIFADYGLALAGGTLVQTADEAVTAAEALGWPVVAKIQSPQIPHKTEAGGVALNLRDAGALRAAVEQILASARAYAPGADIHGVLIQPMLKPGLELIAGVKADPDFGPIVMCGLGGIHVELFRDLAFGPAPLTLRDARAMLASLKAAPMLDGMRGARPRDKEAMADLLVRLSRFADDNRDRIDEIDLNPVFLHEAGQGLSVADALILLKEGAHG